MSKRDRWEKTTQRRVERAIAAIAAVQACAQRPANAADANAICAALRDAVERVSNAFDTALAQPTAFRLGGHVAGGEDA